MGSNIGRNLLHVITVSHSRSSHKINIPIDIARETGIDKSECVIIVKKGNNKAEIKRYDKTSDLNEYLKPD